MHHKQKAFRKWCGGPAKGFLLKAIASHSKLCYTLRRSKRILYSSVTQTKNLRKRCGSTAKFFCFRVLLQGRKCGILCAEAKESRNIFDTSKKPFAKVWQRLRRVFCCPKTNGPRLEAEGRRFAVMTIGRRSEALVYSPPRRVSLS